MINKLIEGLYNFLYSLTGTVTQPISDMLNNNFPDLTTAIANVKNFIYSLASVIGWFVNLIPRPFTLLMLTTFLAVFIVTFPSWIWMDILGMNLDLLKRIWPFGGK